jgi:hypothetical protein
MSNIIPDIKTGDIGTRFRVVLTKVRDDIPPSEVTGDPDQRVPVDLRTATQTFVKLETPKGTAVSLEATILDAINGLIEHIDTAGVFEVDGRWKISGSVEFDSGNFFQGTWTGFLVGT